VLEFVSYFITKNIKLSLFGEQRSSTFYPKAFDFKITGGDIWCKNLDYIFNF
jgi:hypothetical protein